MAEHLLGTYSTEIDTFHMGAQKINLCGQRGSKMQGLMFLVTELHSEECLIINDWNTAKILLQNVTRTNFISNCLIEI